MAYQNAVTITSQPRATAVPVNRHSCPPAFPSSIDFGRAPENTVPLLIPFPRRPSAAPLCRRPAPPPPGPSARRNLPGAAGGTRIARPPRAGGQGSAVGQPRARSPLRAPLIVMQTLSLPAAKSHPSPLEAGSRAGANRIFMRRGKSSATLPEDRGSLLFAFSQASPSLFLSFNNALRGPSRPIPSAAPPAP